MHAASFVESYFDAWNHRDPRGVADHLAVDGVYCDIPINERRSQEELISSLGSFFLHSQHQYEPIGDILTGTDSIAFQYRVMMCDNVDDDGLPGSYYGAEFIRLRGDSAAVITDYYDIPGMARSAVRVTRAVEESSQNKYAKSGLSAAQLHEIKSRLKIMMQSERAFLKSDLNLPALAAAVDCSVNHLSQVINAGFGVSFFDYLNRHRIEYAKQLLGEGSGQYNAILNVAFAVGFNSNSAFYAAFKKCVGQTPAQYRRAHLEKSH